MGSKLLFEKESYQIIGTCIAVHKKLGAGFDKPIYEEVLQKEFKKKKIPFEKQKRLQVFYDGIALKKQFTADFVCYDKIIVNIKSVSFLPPEAKQQVVNYLKATNFKLGLLINFGESNLKWKRVINTTDSKLQTSVSSV